MTPASVTAPPSPAGVLPLVPPTGLTLQRVGTIYSLAQLDGAPQLSLGGRTPAAGVISSPEAALASLEGVVLPQYRYCASNGLGSKQLYSFGSWSDLCALEDASRTPARDHESRTGIAPDRLGSGSLLPTPSSSDAEDSDWTRDEERPRVPFPKAPLPPPFPAKAAGEDARERAAAPPGPPPAPVPRASLPLLPQLPVRSSLDMVLLSEWEDRAERGLLRYDVTCCPTRLLPGPFGFVAQSNPGRASHKRPTEFKVDCVAQAWDEAKFHFLKARQAEVLFAFEPAPDIGASPSKARGLSVASPRTPGRALSGKPPPPLAARGRNGVGFLPGAPAPANPSLVLVNVSPIEYGHVLLVPHALARKPQAVDAQGLQVALRFAREVDNPYFRLGFNSLGAYATVNHLHFQAYYLPFPFPVERVPVVGLPSGGREGVFSAPGREDGAPNLELSGTLRQRSTVAAPLFKRPRSALRPPRRPAPDRTQRAQSAELLIERRGGLAGAEAPPGKLGSGAEESKSFASPEARGGLGAASGTGVRVGALQHYPVRSLVFEAGASERAFAEVLAAACEELTRMEVPHNLLVTDRGSRAFLFPNAYALRKAQGGVPEALVASQVDPGCWEMAGHMVYKRERDFEAASEESAWELLRHASLDARQFERVVARVLAVVDEVQAEH